MQVNAVLDSGAAKFLVKFPFLSGVFTKLEYGIGKDDNQTSCLYKETESGVQNSINEVITLQVRQILIFPSQFVCTVPLQ